MLTGKHQSTCEEEVKPVNSNWKRIKQETGPNFRGFEEIMSRQISWSLAGSFDLGHLLVRIPKLETAEPTLVMKSKVLMTGSE